MPGNSIYVLFDALAEVQAMLHDHYECRTYEPTEGRARRYRVKCCGDSCREWLAK